MRLADLADAAMTPLPCAAMRTPSAPQALVLGPGQPWAGSWATLWALPAPRAAQGTSPGVAQGLRPPRPCAQALSSSSFVGVRAAARPGPHTAGTGPCLGAQRSLPSWGPGPGWALRASRDPPPGGSSSGEGGEGGDSPGLGAAVVDAVVEGVDAAVEGVSLMGEISESAREEAQAGQMVDYDTALKTVAFWVAAAALFGAGIGVAEGPSKASQFLAGYLLELSLSVDNLFVFVLIFDYFQVPAAYQSKVLAWGIAGAVVFRAILIGLGLSAVSAFESVNIFFAAILIFSSIKLLSDNDEDEEDLSQNVIVSFCRKLIPVTDYYDGNSFFVTEGAIRKATPLLLTLAVVELTDIFFAFDSIPAIFGVTQDPFIVFTSNIFAILGLRSLFTVIATSMADLRFLQPAIAVVLGFIGSKLLADYFGYEISTETSLFVVATLLSGGVFLSLRFPKEDKGDSL